MILKALKKAIKQLYPQRTPASRIREKILHDLAVIGGRLFGPLAEGQERLFYTRDRKTIVWKEGNTTTYYQVTAQGILKTQDDHPAEYIDEIEARRLQQALRTYRAAATTYLRSITART